MGAALMRVAEQSEDISQASSVTGHGRVSSIITELGSWRPIPGASRKKPCVARAPTLIDVLEHATEALLEHLPVSSRKALRSSCRATCVAVGALVKQLHVTELSTPSPDTQECDEGMAEVSELGVVSEELSLSPSPEPGCSNTCVSTGCNCSTSSDHVLDITRAAGVATMYGHAANGGLARRFTGVLELSIHCEVTEDPVARVLDLNTSFFARLLALKMFGVGQADIECVNTTSGEESLWTRLPAVCRQLTTLVLAPAPAFIDLSALASLTHLELDSGRITDKQLTAISSNVGLRTLKLSRCHHVTDAGLTALQPLSKLETLQLEVTTMQGTGMSSLVSSPNLRSIVLKTSHGLTRDGAESLAQLSQVTSLDLSFSYVSSEVLDGLAGMRGLKALILEDCYGTPSIQSAALTKLAWQRSAELQDLLSVDTTTARDSALPKELEEPPLSLRSILALSNLRGLSSLSLRGTFFAVWRAAEVLADLTGLSRLDLHNAASCNNVQRGFITDDDVVLRTLCRLSGLRSLTVHATPALLYNLANTEASTRLTHLGLLCLDVRDLVWFDMSLATDWRRCVGLANVHTLDLSLDTLRATSKDLSLVARLLSEVAPNVRELLVSATSELSSHVDDHFLVSLAALRGLQCLRLCGLMGVTATGLAHLMLQAPGLTHLQVSHCFDSRSAADVQDVLEEVRATRVRLRLAP